MLSVLGGEFGNSFPAAQAHPVVPGFAETVARGEVLLVEFVALEDLGENAFHRKIVGVQNGIRGPNRGSVMGVARGNHRQSAKLRVFESVSIVSAQSGGSVENFDRVD